MPWYLLPPSTQKGLISGLHYIQNGPKYTIGPFAELSFETATDVNTITMKKVWIL